MSHWHWASGSALAGAYTSPKRSEQICCSVAMGTAAFAGTPGEAVTASTVTAAVAATEKRRMCMERLPPPFDPEGFGRYSRPRGVGRIPLLAARGASARWSRCEGRRRRASRPGENRCPHPAGIGPRRGSDCRWSVLEWTHDRRSRERRHPRRGARAARDRRSIGGPGRGRAAAGRGRVGGDALGRLASPTRRTCGSAPTATPASRSPGRARRWWRSSRWPSSPPPSGCPPTPDAATSARRSSCATASRGSGPGSRAGTWRRGRRVASQGPRSP